MHNSFSDIKAIDMHIRQMLSNMGMMATGAAFQNKYKSDVIRKSRARNTQKKKVPRPASYMIIRTAMMNLSI